MTSFTRRTSPCRKGGLSQDVDVQHELAHLLLELPDLFVLQGLFISGTGPKRILVADRHRSFHSSTSETVSPWARAASRTEVSPFKMLNTKAARLLADPPLHVVGDLFRHVCHLQVSFDHVSRVASIWRGAGYDGLGAGRACAQPAWAQVPLSCHRRRLGLGRQRGRAARRRHGHPASPALAPLGAMTTLSCSPAVSIALEVVRPSAALHGTLAVPDEPEKQFDAVTIPGRRSSHPNLTQ